MASTTTPTIELFKATPGTNEPFRTSDINDNMDLIDAAFSAEGLAPLVQDTLDDGLTINGGTA
jgi:hypothetical protein